MNEHEEKSEHGLHRFHLQYEEVKRKAGKRTSVFIVALMLPAVALTVSSTLEYLSKLA